MTVSFHASGQTGNEWIDYNRPYYKIPTAKDGIYKLTYNDLANAGVPVASLDPKTLQIFHRGREQSIFVSGEDDHQFNPSDFLEFYGKRNDGTLDAELYKQPSFQPHKYHNLYSDTTAYFLTYGGPVGKRMSLFIGNADNLTPEVYHFNETLVLNTDGYTSGKTDAAGQTLNTYFDRAEGWTGTRINVNTSRSQTINNIVRGEPVGGKPQLEVMIVSILPVPTQAQITLGSSNRLWKTVDITGNNFVVASGPIEWSDINASGGLVVTVKATLARVSVSFIKVKFPQTFNVSGETEKVLNLLPHGTGQSYITLQNATAGLRLFDITDPENPVRINTTSMGTLNAVVGNTQTSRAVLATATAITPSIRRVTFRSINPAEFDYIMITHPLLRKPGGKYSDPVKAYASYRASEQGGGYDTLLLNIRDVYDQFNYGELSPRAIFQFMKYLTNVKVPRYFFIVGKAIDLSYNYNRNPTATTFNIYKDLVPTAGVPGSDNFFTIGLAGTTYEPAVPTGRLSAVNASQVAAYLDKVIETESNQFADLQKKTLLHLSGGIEDGEHARFKSYVDEFKRVAEGYQLGGKVISIAKRTPDVKLISVAEEINRGVGLVTFFGHSSSTALDFDIGFATDPVMGYDNKGKYPMMLIHGCNVGSYFSPNTSFGEDWILAANKGAIGFLAHSYYGFEGNLKWYGDNFYRVGYQDPLFISKRIGDVLKETSRRFMDGLPENDAIVNQSHQMVLLGDPAVALFGAGKPDYEINSGSVSFESFDGKPVTALTDSFKLKVVIRNLGIAREEPFRIQVTRTNNNFQQVIDTIVDPILYSDTITITIRKPNESVAGTNVFTIKVDADHLIDEINESNNEVSRELFIPRNGTRNLYPRDFAIVNEEHVNLFWQTTDVLSDDRNFILEIDTARTFESPYKKQFNLSGRVLVNHEIQLLDLDTLAYYWRTKLAEPQEDESAAWETTSFTIIHNSPDGWAQTHFPQFEENTFDGLIADPSARAIKLQETVTSVAIKNFGTAHVATNFDVSVKIKGVEYNINIQGYGCRDNSINLIAFDRRSTIPYMGVPFKWYDRANRSCGREPWVINNFRPTEMATGSNDLIAYVNNIPAGDSVVLFSIGNAAYPSWPAAAKTKLGELGISLAQINAMKVDEPVVIFARKGAAPGTAKFYTAPASPTTAELYVNETVTGRYTSGAMTSSLIGPALAWSAFDQYYTGKESQDEIRYDIIGVKHNGTEDILFDGITVDQNLSAISAETYPYLKINVVTADNLNLTTPQVNHWIVLYTPVPEGFIIFDGPRTQQTYPEGVTWKGAFGFINISDREFSDSLEVRYDTYNYQKGNLASATKKIKPPAPRDTTHFNIDISTFGREGMNDIDVYVNPRVIAEQYYDNNVMSFMQYLNVIPDQYHPVLEVTVDGRRLMEGDYVSTDPEIVVRLWDENKFSFKDDPEGMRILLTYPCEEEDCEPVTIDLSSEDVKWYPATADQPFRIDFRPKSLPDGYYLLHVEAVDVIGNAAGVEPYKIGFNVEADVLVNIATPYPNPFSSLINFTVVVSGNSAPEYLAIQLVDVNGKLLHEITPANVIVGTNRWSWDGTDQYGNILPKGIYICKTTVRMQGKDYNRTSKIVLLR